MKNWTSRFVILMVAGAIMCSALMVGCGGKTEDDTDSNAPANTSSTTSSPPSAATATGNSASGSNATS